jgi:hypothetical protein
MTMMDLCEYDGNEPEPSVAATMLKPDVLITSVNRSITHSNTTAEAKDAGTRVISMVKFSDERLVYGSL